MSENLETGIETLLNVCEQILKSGQLKHDAHKDLLNAVLDVYEHFPEDQDPKSMGWVGDDGRP